MKIKKINISYQNKLTKLQLLKSRIYKKTKNSKLKNKIEINKTQIYLKKIIHIIYEFHINNKRILFLNFPKNFEKKINKYLRKNQHIFINNENFINGILSNQKINFQQSGKLQKFIRSNSRIKVPIKKLINLIVIFNPVSSLNSDKTLFISQIPTITINENFNNNQNYQNYKLIGNFKFIEKQINNNIFFSILKAILKNKIVKK